jgi:hypothetical protein
MINANIWVIFTNKPESFFNHYLRLPIVKLHTGLNTFTSDVRLRVYRLNLLTEERVSSMSLVECPYFANIWIRIVIFPPDQNVNIANSGNAFEDIDIRKIILSERHNIFDSLTIKLFNLPIEKQYIYYVCKYGRFDILEWLIRNNYKISYDYNNILESCYGGNVNILKWWLNDFELPDNFNFKRFFADAFEKASQYCNINMLEWLLKYKKGFNKKVGNKKGIHMNMLTDLYLQKRLKEASISGSLEILNFWKNNINIKRWDNFIKQITYVDFKYILPPGIIHNQEVLDWWSNEGFDQYIDQYIDILIRL